MAQGTAGSQGVGLVHWVRVRKKMQGYLESGTDRVVTVWVAGLQGGKGKVVKEGLAWAYASGLGAWWLEVPWPWKGARKRS